MKPVISSDITIEGFDLNHDNETAYIWYFRADDPQDTYREINLDLDAVREWAKENVDWIDDDFDMQIYLTEVFGISDWDSFLEDWLRENKEPGLTYNNPADKPAPPPPDSSQYARGGTIYSYSGFIEGISGTEYIDIQASSEVVRVNCYMDKPDNRKEPLHINRDRIAKQLEAFWKDLRPLSTKIQSLAVDFIPQDHYENYGEYTGGNDGSYDVASFHIKRGLKRVRIEEDYETNVPKEWQIGVSCVFKFTKTKTPYMAFIEGCFGVSFTNTNQKKIEKELRKVLQGKTKYISLNFHDRDYYTQGGDIEVGDWVQHKKGDASGRGQVYKKDDLGIYLKDQYGNESHKIFQTRNFKHKGKPKYAEGGEIIKLNIAYLNKDKNHQKDRKHFKGKDWNTVYGKAVKWGQKHLDSFHDDMINVEYGDGGEISDKVVVDYMKALEESGIMAKNSHKNAKAIGTIKSIISMPKQEIGKNPSQNVRMIYNEYNDWIQTYADGGEVKEKAIEQKTKEGLRIIETLKKEGKFEEEDISEVADMMAMELAGSVSKKMASQQGNRENEYKKLYPQLKKKIREKIKSKFNIGGEMAFETEPQFDLSEDIYTVALGKIVASNWRKEPALKKYLIDGGSKINLWKLKDLSSDDLISLSKTITTSLRTLADGGKIDKKSANKWYDDQDLAYDGYSVSDWTPGAWRKMFLFLVDEGFSFEGAKQILLSKHTRWARDYARNEGKSENQLSTFPDWISYYGNDGKEVMSKMLSEELGIHAEGGGIKGNGGEMQKRVGRIRVIEGVEGYDGETLKLEQTVKIIRNSDSDYANHLGKIIDISPDHNRVTLLLENGARENIYAKSLSARIDNAAKFPDGGDLPPEIDILKKELPEVFDIREPDEWMKKAKPYKLFRKANPKKIDDFLTDDDLDIVEELEKKQKKNKGGKVKGNDILIKEAAKLGSGKPAAFGAGKKMVNLIEIKESYADGGEVEKEIQTQRILEIQKKYNYKPKYLVSHSSIGEGRWHTKNKEIDVIVYGYSGDYSSLVVGRYAKPDLQSMIGSKREGGILIDVFVIHEWDGGMGYGYVVHNPTSNEFDDVRYKDKNKSFLVQPNSDISFIVSKKYADGGEVSLFFQQGSSDKEYHIQLEKDNGGYLVNFQYGRRGSALKSGTKTATPVSLPEAQKIYDKLLNSKVSKGYSVYQSTQQQFSGNPVAPKTVHRLPQLLNMVFTAEEFINDDSYLAQEKRDGERRMVVSSPNGTMGLNKKGQEVPLPNKIIDSIDDECTIDGEIIGDILFAFDILSLNGQDLEGEPCIERISTLNTLKFGNGVKVVSTAYDTEAKQKLFDKLKREHREGIVFKKKDAPYTHGRPNSGGSQLKYKFYKTATFIVANITPGKRSVGLELLDNGNRMFMGKVTIPPNKDIPNVGDFVEVRYLYAYKGGAIFQPTYLSKRTDSDLTDATIDQIIYKSDKMAKGGEVSQEDKDRIGQLETISWNYGELTDDEQNEYDALTKKYASGGEVIGKSHAKGGEKFTVKSTGQLVELEGGEGVLKKSAMDSEKEYTLKGTPKEIASCLNEEYDGVNFRDDGEKCDISQGKYASGGSVRRRPGRKGPTDSATWHIPGTKMEGNDGNIWCVEVNINGIHRWVKCKH